MATAPNEFADWLSPVLVKELRQGLRTRVFVGSFILLQIAMVFLSIFGLTAAAASESTESYTSFFWVLVAVPLLLAMPASGLGAVAAERKAQTLEMLFLSRLTSRRILFGKWVALLLQSVLLVCAVVPYAVLRYFLGSVNVTQELELLATMLFLSAVFAGVAVGLSPLPLPATRAIAILAVMFGMQGLPALLMMARFSGSLGFMMGPAFVWPVFSVWAVVAGALTLGLAVLYLFWEYGAGLIAPPVENHSTPLRLLALGCLGLATPVTFLLPKYAALASVAAVLIGLSICLGLLSENPRFIPGLYRPFVKRGFAGRLSGFLLYPGWPSGVLFTVLFFALSCWLSGRIVFPHPKPDELATLRLTWLTGLGIFLVPVAAIRLFLPRVPRPFLAFFIFQIGCLLLFASTSIARAFSRSLDLRPVFRFIPTYALFATEPAAPMYQTAWRQLGPACLVTMLSVLVLLWQMRGPWQKIRACEQHAASQP